MNAKGEHMISRYKRLLLIVMFPVLVFVVQPTFGFSAPEDCDGATRLVTRAFDLRLASGTSAEQKTLLRQALEICPKHPEAHNNLASILEDEKDYPQALSHYEQAVRARPGFSEAWFGIGEVYYKTGRFTQSLEAYLKACKTDGDARGRITELLNTHRYHVSEAGEVMDRENLLMLFDKNRRAEINRMIAACGFRADVQPVFVFRNILFDVASAALKTESMTQIREIGAALKKVPSAKVVVSGHTDRQPFHGVSQEESDRRNIELSKQRADAVVKELAAMGLPAGRMEAVGYGPTKPEAAEDTPEAYAKNRRVTIELVQ